MGIVIGIDFDGTCTTHDFPHIGKDIGAVPVLKKLVAAGHQLLLTTMRSDKVGEDVESPEFTGIKGDYYLKAAVKWFKDNDITLWAIQTNPSQAKWTDSPKAYYQLLIDDVGLGIPLIYNPKISDKVFVNWKAVEVMLIERGIL